MATSGIAGRRRQGTVLFASMADYTSTAENPGEAAVYELMGRVGGAAFRRERYRRRIDPSRALAILLRRPKRDWPGRLTLANQGHAR